MPRSFARRLAEPFLSDSPMLPLHLICLLCGLILFDAGQRDPPIQEMNVSPEMVWIP